MRPESIAWERAAEIRDAADGWRQAGAISASTHEAIRNTYPDRCVTPSAVWRALTAVMVTAVVLCSFGAFALAIKPSEVGLSLLLWLFGAACVVASELLEASPRFAQRGAAGAAAFWGSSFSSVDSVCFSMKLPRSLARTRCACSCSRAR